MIIFEDLHWIEEDTQAFLNLLADSIGTARLLLLVNYRPEYTHQWHSKTYYTYLRLDPLPRESAGEMLDALLGLRGQATDASLAALQRLIIEKTEGTPLFMEEIYQSLIEEGALVRNGAVKLTRSLETLKIPSTVQDILASRIDRLQATEKQLLQTLAVIGKEFPLALARQVVRKPGDEIDHMLNDLQLAEFVYEQPAAGEIEYTFKHALTREVAYNSVLLERRKQLHEQIGAGIEALYANSIDDHLDELAHHYSRSDNVAKAVEYLGRAGQQALKHSAYAGAIGNLSLATKLLEKLPNGTERIEREMFLQLALGPAFEHTKGFAAHEVERVYTRARELCEQLGDRRELFDVLYGLWVMHHVRGDLRAASKLAEQLRERAQRARDPALTMQASTLCGAASFYEGELLSSREQLVTALSLYDPEQHRLNALQYGVDAKVGALSFLALTLWQLGYVDQAAKQSDESLAWAQGLSHPFSLAFAEYFVGILRQSRREPRAAQEHAEAGIRLSEEHGFIQFLAWSTGLHGWVMVEQGRREEGVAQIREGLEMSRSARDGLWRPYFLCLLAETCIETNSFDNGLSALTEALAISDELGIGFSKPEIHRLKGESLLRKNDSNVAEAKRCFERAIEVAQNQNAKSLQLRAITSLARLLAKHGKRDEAHAMLADIYNWFTEGFDTADLKDAKALLDELKAL
jgi:predicted ATPase